MKTPMTPNEAITNSNTRPIFSVGSIIIINNQPSLASPSFEGGITKMSEFGIIGVHSYF